MATEYKVCFKYDGEEPRGSLRSYVEQVFCMVYNEYCKLTNPMYETWNNEYSGPNDGFDENGYINSDGEYNKYIREKQSEIVDYINKAMHKLGDSDLTRCFKEFFIGEECDFRARLTDGTEMQFFLKEA